MTNSGPYVALVASLCIAASVGCSAESPVASDQTPAAGTASEPSVATSSADYGSDSVDQASRAPLAMPEPKAPVVGTSDKQDAQLTEMRKPYTNLSTTESRYFDGKFLNSATVGEVMRSPDFNSKVQDLQSSGDAGAMSRQQAYTELFRRSLQPYADRARLETIGCGTVLCMGSLRTSTKDWIGPWTIALHQQPLPLPSLSIQPVRRGNEYDVRFSFTTSGAGGISSPRQESASAAP